MMQLEAVSPRNISDSYRDAEKYHRLLLALTRATAEIREIGEDIYSSLEEVLGRLLPDLAEALNAQQAFVALWRQESPKGQAWLELTAVSPKQELVGRTLACSEMLQQLVRFGKPRVIDPLGEPTPNFIPGLELFEAISAILVRVQTLDQVYVVGLCNQANPKLGPFLAVDGKALDSIVELLAIGAQVGERRRRELESIQDTSAAISAKLDLDELLPTIVRGAAEVFDAPAASLRLWDEGEENLVIRAKWGLSDEYAQRQRIPREKVEAIIRASGEFQPLLTTDLQNQPFGNVDLITQEHLQAVLVAPLRVREQLIGLLNIYSRDQSRRSTAYEQGLAQIFASQAAIAVQNAELYSGARSRAKQLHDVLAAAQNITALRPIREVLQAITDSLVDNFGYDAVTLFPYQAEAETFDRPVISGRLRFPEVVLGKVTPGTLVEKRLSGPEFYFTANSPGDPLLAGRFTQREGIQASGYVRLSIGQEVVGILFVNYRSPHTFEEAEQQAVRLFANQAAVAIQNARQYDRLKRWRERLLALHESAKAVSASLERQSTLQSILEEAARLTEAHFATIQEKREECLYFAAIYPSEQSAQLKKEIGEAMPLDGPGITVKVANTGQPCLVNDVHQVSIFVDGTNQKTCSELAVPLLENGQVRGVLNVEHPKPGAFDQDDVEVLTALANLAVLALQNAERYERLKKTEEHLKAFHKVGRSILARAGLEIARAGLELDTAMRVILEQALAVTGAFFGTVQLVEGDELKLVAVLPPERLANLAGLSRMPIAGRGITARAVRQNHVQFVPDVTRDPDFVDITGETGSELAVVLRRGGRQESLPLGVLNVEHRQVGGLNEEDRYLLIGLADLAVVSLDYVQQAEQLSRTNAIALMGAWGADIVHDVNREVGAIRRVVFSLLQRPDLEPELRERLQKIDSYADSLALPELPERAPEPGYIPTIRDAPLLDEVIRSEVAKLQQAHPAITLLVRLNCAGARVAMQEQWVRRVVRHLVKNAVNAVSKEKGLRQIAVQTRLREAMADVLVEDTGKGVRPEIETLLFRRPIPYTGPQAAEREGRGLLLVRYVVEMHGGQVWLDWSQPGQGARFAFNVPLAPPEAD